MAEFTPPAPPGGGRPELLSIHPPSNGDHSGFVDPAVHETDAITLVTVGLTLVTSSVFLRLYTRKFITRKLSWDDFFCLVSWILTVTFQALLLKVHYRGPGVHFFTMDPASGQLLLKVIFVFGIMYLPTILAIKITFLLFFIRIFNADKRTRYMVYFGIFACTVFYTAIFFRTLFICSPIEKNWQPFAAGYCQPSTISAYTIGIFNAVSDIYILVLPLPLIWRLNMTVSRRIKVMAVFSLGSFAVISSIIRLVITCRTVSNTDVGWNGWNLSLWATLEIDIGLICSCALAFPAFFDKHFPHGLHPYYSRLMSLLASSRHHHKSNGSRYTSHGGNSTNRLHQGSENNLRRCPNDDVESKKSFVTNAPGIGMEDPEAAREKSGRTHHSSADLVDGRREGEGGDGPDWRRQGILKSIKIDIAGE